MNKEIAQDGLVVAFLLDGDGGGTAVGWPEIESWQAEGRAFMWLHLDYSRPNVQQWLKQRKGLDYLVVDNLLAEDSRPRSTPFHEGLLLGLRGVNPIPGADPEDMVAIRLWIDRHLIISSSQRPLVSIDDMRQAIESGGGPAAPGEFLAQICEFVMDRVGDVVEDFESIFDDIEETIMGEQGRLQQPMLSSLRRQIIEIRRYLAPQRDALGAIQGLRNTWLGDADRLRLREVADRLYRYVEELDSIRDRAVVLHEELVSRLSEEMNRRMYALALVATIFMPLGFLTGLLGVNLGGIPGADGRWGFAVFCLLVVIAFIGQLLYLKNKKWI